MYERPKEKMFKDEVQQLTKKDGYVLVIYEKKVYNVNNFVPFHPGGEAVIRNSQGKNSTRTVQNIYNHPNQKKVLEKLAKYHFADYEGERPKPKEKKKPKKDLKGYIQSKDAVMCTWKD